MPAFDPRNTFVPTRPCTGTPCATNQRGVSTFDWGGGGAYKEKYGCRTVFYPWFRMSRFPVLEHLRSQARNLVAIKQHLGRVKY
jgi:hypothetical protein